MSGSNRIRRKLTRGVALFAAGATIAGVAVAGTYRPAASTAIHGWLQ